MIVRGSSGCGKTAVLELAERLGAASGMRVLSARGSQFERGFAFGTARQLLGASVGSHDARVFAGSARWRDPCFSRRPTGCRQTRRGVAAGLVEAWRC